MSPKKHDQLTPKEAALAQAFERAFSAHTAAIAETGGGQIIAEPDFTLAILPQAHRMSGVISPQFTEENAAARIEVLLAAARECRQDIYIRLGPSTSPADMAARLQRRGLKRSTTARYMGMDLCGGLPDFPIPTGARVFLVEDYAWFTQMPHPFYGKKGSPRKTFMYTAFERLSRQEPCRHWAFAVEEHDHFAGAGRMFLHKDIVVGFDFAILKSVRRKGLGAALICTMGEFARQQGARWAVLNTSTDGARFYPNFGFTHIGGYPSFQYTLAQQKQES